MPATENDNRVGSAIVTMNAMSHAIAINVIEYILLFIWHLHSHEA